jgi:phosphotransferase system enzyme I (PtsI)
MKINRQGPERVLTGLGVSPGLALGWVHLSDRIMPAIAEYRLTEDELAPELERFKAAVAMSRQQLASLKDKTVDLPGRAADDVGHLLDAHLAMLTESRLLRGVVARIRDQLINAEAAVHLETLRISESFAQIDDAYLAARVEDIRVVAGRLIRNLTSTPYAALNDIAQGAVLLAEELTPADTALLNPNNVVGFATVLGGAEGHTAIMARALGIPAVLGCSELLERGSEGATVIVDGDAGTVTLNPSETTLAAYHERTLALTAQRQRLKLVGQLPAVTRDGVAVSLQANLELPRELDLAIEAGADGIGLVRTEFLFMNRTGPPDEEEQFAAMLTLVEGMKGREVTIRTLDIGGEKLTFPLRGVMLDSTNPALGLRAVRLGLRYPEILDVQLSAILRAAAAGPIRILLPMISSLREVREVRQRLLVVWEKLQDRGVRLPARIPPLGIMIEVPGAALSADAFAHEADFFAIGTNDLTQYTLAIDRSDDQVADLYNPLHPAVLRLIQFTTEAALRASIPVSVCGEIAGDPRYTALLLGLGIRCLSMASASLAPVKQALRDLTMPTAQSIARQVMFESDETRIQQLIALPSSGNGGLA